MLRYLISYLDQLIAGLFKSIENAPLIIKLPALIIGFTIIATIAMIADSKDKKSSDVL